MISAGYDVFEATNVRNYILGGRAPNLAMAWMTHKLQGVLDDRLRAGRAVPGAEILRHIAPVHSEGINFRGRFHFPIKTYASRILSAA